MCIVHLSVFGPHTALEKWRVEKEHKNNKKNVASWFCLLFLNLGFLSLLCLYFQSIPGPGMLITSRCSKDH